jgi:aconitate hydratase
VEEGDEISLPGVRDALLEGRPLTLINKTRNKEISLTYTLTKRQRSILLAGGLLNYTRAQAG